MEQAKAIERLVKIAPLPFQFSSETSPTSPVSCQRSQPLAVAVPFFEFRFSNFVFWFSHVYPSSLPQPLLFLRAVPRPEELIAAAQAHGMPAVALTDTNGLYAAVPFYLAARDAGVKPILAPCWMLIL